MTFRFLTPALTELSKAAEYYESEVAGLGNEFLDAVDEAIARILRFPLAWSKLSEDYRHCRLRRFPYAIIYTVENNSVTIISVFHLHREPKSWQGNL